jgi:hypothetical protein
MKDVLGPFLFPVIIWGMIVTYLIERWMNRRNKK